MNKSIDEMLREKLTGTCNVPESFERKINETIHDIENCEIRKSSGHGSWLSMNKVACVVLLLMLSVITVTSYAAVNLFQDRMNAMPEEVREKYNNDVQESNAEADAYSRKLTDSEEEKMMNLRKQYEKEGRFPQKEIEQVKSSEDIVKSELYFVAEESKFYLPDRTLSDEEMLEIIDLQEKRDYSVQQQNLAGDESDREVKANARLEERSIEVVTELYNMDEGDLEIVSSDVEDGCYVYEIKGENVLFSVYCSGENEIERVILKKGNLPAHQSGVKSKGLKIKPISKRLKKQAEVFTGKKAESQSIYSLVDDRGNLAYGTVSCYNQMADGSGCVAVYSSAYQDLYDIYTIDDVTMMQKFIREKKQAAKKNGYTYKSLKE